MRVLSPKRESTKNRRHCLEKLSAPFLEALSCGLNVCAVNNPKEGRTSETLPQDMDDPRLAVGCPALHKAGTR